MPVAWRVVLSVWTTVFPPKLACRCCCATASPACTRLDPVPHGLDGVHPIDQRVVQQKPAMHDARGCVEAVPLLLNLQEILRCIVPVRVPFSILIINLLEEQSILLYILLRAYAYAYALACNCLCACLSFFLTGGDFSLKDFSLIRITCTWNPHTYFMCMCMCVRVRALYYFS